MNDFPTRDAYRAYLQSKLAAAIAALADNEKRELFPGGARALVDFYHDQLAAI